MSFKNCIAVALMSIFSVAAMAQNKVSGKVTDPNGEPVIGAGVTQVGTQNGVVTDFEGAYSFSAPVGATINVEALGFDAQQFKVVAGQTTYKITLSESSLELDETVVIGYGTQKKKLVTGSTINVSGDLIQKQNTTSALGALYSNVPGVNIVQNTGQPGDGYKITVRGISTTGSSSPLFVIDGVAGGNIDHLNPADIESIDILKDAASSAIYGARAASGVVLVTTRQGKRDSKVNVTFDGSLGFQEANLNGVHAVSATEYVDLVNRAMVAAGTIKEGECFPDIDPKLYPVQKQWMDQGKWNGADWLGESVNHHAPQNNMVIGINGGNDLVRFSLSYSKSYQEGTLGWPNVTYYDRNTIRANTEFSLIRRQNRDILVFGENTTATIYKQHGVSTGNIYSNDIHNYLTYTPLLPVYDIVDGGYYGYEDQKRDNWQAKDGGYNQLERASIGDRESRNYRLNGNVYLQFTPTREWRFRSAFGFRFNASFNRSYTPEYHLSGTSYNEYDDVSQSGSVGNSYTWENTLTWTKELGDHNIEALIGTSMEGTKWGMSVNGTRQDTTFKTWESANLSSSSSDINATNVSIGGGNTIPYNDLLSFFGRVNYNFKDTYLFTAILRADGSKNFASGHRWGYFPSASAGVILTNFDWMDWSKGILDYFKLRASWGQNGNCSISNFQYASLVSMDARYDFSSGLSVSPGAYPSRIPNPDLKWETSEQTDLGFDARLFKSRLGVAFDLYRKDTKDWLVDAPTLGIHGAAAPTINGGAVRNQGVELSLTWNDHVGDFFYNLGINGSYNHNEVLYINNADGILHGGTNVIAQNIDRYNTFEARPGKPIGYFSGIASDGIFQNQKEIDEWNNAGKAFMDGYENAQPGDVKWIDQDGDGDFDYDDIVEVGNPHPDFNLGFNISLQWKGFDFSVNGSGAFGQQVVQSYRSFANSDVENYTNNFVARLWTGEGSTNKFPRFSNGKNNNFYCGGYLGDIWLQDADYLKIRNITIGYDLKKAIKKLPLASLRVYASGQNLFCFTGYDGMDPEVGYGYGYSWASGIDIGYYPSPKVYLFGVNIKF